MAVNIVLEAETLVDPTGAPRKPISLAPRLAGVKGKTILLFDNTQLTGQLVNYGPIFTWLADILRNQGADSTTRSSNLFDLGAAEMVELADDIAKSGAAGVVLALCKAGMTQPTSLLAVELEKRGLPCVQLCTEHSIALAKDNAASYAPGLPVVLVPLASGDKDSLGKSETASIAPEILSGLTTDAAALLKAFQAERQGAGEKTNLMSLAPLNASGTDQGGRVTAKIDPGAFDEALYVKLCAEEMGDGLPVIAPTEARVAAMLAASDFHPDHALVSDCPPSGAAITVKSLAANAVMAGCKPEYFPVLIAAMQAIADPAYRLFQGAITTHPAGNAVVVSGPLVKQLGLQSGGGCLGPGFRANATIGRAINLTIMNVTRAVPGKTDMSVFGSPCEFTYCFAESDDDNPWSPIHTELYGPEITSVTVHKCESPHNVLEPRPFAPETLLKTVAAVGATVGGNNMTHLGQLLVLLNPGQAKGIADAGWSKQDIKEYLFEVARHPQEATTRRLRSIFPPYFHKLAMVPVMREPDDAIVVVCGAKGPHAMVAVPWGLAEAVSRPVLDAKGQPVTMVKRT